MKHIFTKLFTLVAAFLLIFLLSCLNNETPIVPTQDEEYRNEIYLKYVDPINRGLAIYSWETPSEISADVLIVFCSNNNLLQLSGPYGDYEGLIFLVPATEVEAAISQYFDGLSPEHLRTSQFYEYDEIPGHDSTNKYYMPMGYSSGCDSTVLHVEEDGDILRIVGQSYAWYDYDTPMETFLLTVRLEQDGFKYLSCEVFPQLYYNAYDKTYS